MPIYEYVCSKHGVQERLLPFREVGPLKEYPCMLCKKPSMLQISAPAIVDVQRDWNEKANEYQRNSYTKAKAQITNSYNEEAERTGKSPRKVTEEAIQVAAESIDRREKNPAPTDAQRHAILAKKVKKNNEK